MVVSEIVAIDGLTTTYGLISIGAIYIELLSSTVAFATVTALDPALAEILLTAIIGLTTFERLPLLTVPLMLAV
jgi:hypothetical protein